MGEVMSCYPPRETEVHQVSNTPRDREIIRVRPCQATVVNVPHRTAISRDWNPCECIAAEEIKPTPEAEARRGIEEAKARMASRRRIERQQKADERYKAVEKTLKRLEGMTEGNRCVICLEAEASHILIPCGHQCLCTECSKHYNGCSQKCPLCRAPSRMAVKVFRAELNAVAAFKKIRDEEEMEVEDVTEGSPLPAVQG